MTTTTTTTTYFKRTVVFIVNTQHSSGGQMHNPDECVDCACAENVPFRSVCSSHPPSDSYRWPPLVAEIFEVWTLTTQVLSHCRKQHEHRVCFCVLKKNRSGKTVRAVDPGSTMTWTSHRSTKFATFAPAAFWVLECVPVR